jgi:signal transduction histidine kinase
LSADRDALTQIVGQLLTNAYLVSPPDSEIFITARQETVNLLQNGNSKPTDSLLVSVEDRGGGITPEDEARVFARKYKAENPLIQGLGDTGVGLSIAKALVEVHGGRLWLETREQVGSIFSFALPLEPVLQGES